jgi:hypothetical protein
MKLCCLKLMGEYSLNAVVHKSSSEANDLQLLVILFSRKH